MSKSGVVVPRAFEASVFSHDLHRPENLPREIASFMTTIARREAVLRRARTANGMCFDLPITRYAMADYLGLTIETVSRQISALKQDDVSVLESMRRVVVPDFARLSVEAGEDSGVSVLW